MDDLLDWNEVWNHQMALALRKWDDERFWYERTQLPPIGLKTSNYADQLIDLMGLLPHHSILDVGCGDGAIAIRIAKRVRQVTALDVNPNMLFPITQRAISQGISNLSFLNQEWLEAEIGRDVGVYDIVLASRFRQITDLHRFLRQMHTAAKDRCYLTWIAEREEMDARICEVLEQAYHPLPDYSIIVNMLRKMGIVPTINIFETTETRRFDSEQEAIEDMMRGYKVESLQIQTKIAELATSELKSQEGYVFKSTNAKWVLIWWRK